MIITANMLNNIESIITNNYFQEEVYTFTTTNGNNLNCTWNQIMAQINNGKLVQIKFNNISASYTDYAWDGNSGQEIEYSITGTGITYDYVLAVIQSSGSYIVYLPKYGWYQANNATTNLVAVSS